MRGTASARMLPKIPSLSRMVGKDAIQPGYPHNEWRAFIARLHRLISIYGDRKDPAGRLVRHLEREMEHLWLFLQEAGVEPTNNLAERTLRFGVLWRKRSLGTASERGGTGSNASSACARRAEFREGEPSRCWSMRWRPLFNLGLGTWIGFRRCLSRECVPFRSPSKDSQRALFCENSIVELFQYTKNSLFSKFFCQSARNYAL